MASELIEKVKRISSIYEDSGMRFANINLFAEESQKVIEALRVVEDLETAARYTGGVRVMVAENDRWCIDSLSGVVFRDSIPLALRAAAEAIKKGGE